MKVSEYYNLDRNQATLDFVDVDIYNDVRLFVDPRALLSLNDKWGNYCVTLIKDFFQTVLTLVKEGNHKDAVDILRQLKEPNETHLGLSVGRSKGTALGDGTSEDIWTKLANSEAVASGLVEDLEDTILLIPGIRFDRISDITTNIIRDALIFYTQEVCSFYNIPLENNVDSGPIWNMDDKNWHSHYTSLPITDKGKLLLVPKAIVRKKMSYNQEEYYNHFILNFLRDKELRENSGLVRVLKSGTPKVYKKDVAEKYGSGKAMIAKYSNEYPQILAQYRRFKETEASQALDNITISGEVPNWDELLHNVTSIPSGREFATQYEREIEKLLTALLYPSLTSPKVQHEIHNGRKRIDITYSNIATNGFFLWLATNYTAPFVFVECKNYSEDPANPEIDQLSGRFSRERGRVGILICRNIRDKQLLIQRCKDTANDGRGFIIILDDDDLTELVSEVKGSVTSNYKFTLMKVRFEELVF